MHPASPGSRKQTRWVAGQEGALCPSLVTRRPLKVQRDEREHLQQWNGAQSWGYSTGTCVLSLHVRPGPAPTCRCGPTACSASLTSSVLADLMPVSPERKCLPSSLLTLTCHHERRLKPNVWVFRANSTRRHKFFNSGLPEEAQARAHTAVLPDDTHADTKKGACGRLESESGRRTLTISSRA